MWEQTEEVGKRAMRVEVGPHGDDFITAARKRDYLAVEVNVK